MSGWKKLILSKRNWDFVWSKEELEKMEIGETKNVINSKVSHLKCVFIFANIFLSEMWQQKWKIQRKFEKKLGFQILEKKNCR